MFLVKANENLKVRNKISWVDLVKEILMECWDELKKDNDLTR